jgi:hypothetical protein
VTTAKTSEGGLVAVAEVTPAAVASQGGLIALAEVLPGAVATQGGLIGVAAVQPVNHITQGGLIVVGNASDCTTRRAQMWQIFRRDGVILRFTSHDADLSWGDQTYESCDSLNETASEQSSDQGDVGSIDLTGILSSGAISEEDIYAGLYDDAFVQVWRVPWDSHRQDLPRGRRLVRDRQAGGERLHRRGAGPRRAHAAEGPAADHRAPRAAGSSGIRTRACSTARPWPSAAR